MIKKTVVLLALGVFVGYCSFAQMTFKESTNEFKRRKIVSYFNDLFFEKGGYENFKMDDKSDQKTYFRLPDKFRRLKGEALFYYELDTNAVIKNIWIAYLKLKSAKTDEVSDYITYYDHNHIGFDLAYLKEVEFDKDDKELTIYLVENEWKNRKFMRQPGKKYFDPKLGNSYIHVLPVRYGPK